MNAKPKGIVLYGLGLNTDYELFHAVENGKQLEESGFDTKKVHVNELLHGEDDLSNYHLLTIPGGFADGDVLGAGKIMAYRIKHGLSDKLQNFIDDDKLVFGPCNGFQIMVKMGLLPGFDGDYRTQTVTLAPNDSGRFEDRWVYLEFNNESPCVFTKGIEEMELGIRHGEGKLITMDKDVLERLRRNNHVVCWYTDQDGRKDPGYPFNPNGSVDDIAGICDETGRVFGLMPHPEAYIHKTNHPRWTRYRDEDIPQDGIGLKIFRNAFDYLAR